MTLVPASLKTDLDHTLREADPLDSLVDIDRPSTRLIRAIKINLALWVLKSPHESTISLILG
jgi:hypothetical protein